MAVFTTTLGIKLIYVLGITNLVGLLLVLFSCRCILGWQPKFLQSRKWYMSFYSYHCWYWRFFILSVLAHTITAFLTFGYPFK